MGTSASKGKGQMWFKSKYANQIIAGNSRERWEHDKVRSWGNGNQPCTTLWGPFLGQTCSYSSISPFTDDWGAAIISADVDTHADWGQHNDAAAAHVHIFMSLSLGQSWNLGQATPVWRFIWFIFKVPCKIHAHRNGKFEFCHFSHGIIISTHHNIS